MIGIIIVVAVVVGLLPLLLLMKVFRGSAANRRLLSTGQVAKAKILQANQTGTYINEQPQVRFLLEVTPTGGVPFQSQATMTIPQIKIPQVQPGSTVDVRYDPADPSRVALAL
jgi:hypothetical protein